jgi:hypothetical protein
MRSETRNENSTETNDYTFSEANEFNTQNELTKMRSVFTNENSNKTALQLNACNSERK